MKLNSQVLFLVLSSSITCSLPMAAQTPGPTATAQPQATLMLVDGVAEQEDPNTHARSSDAIEKRRLSTLSTTEGSHHPESQLRPDTRPIALWLIVQCNDGIPADFGSALYQGKFAGSQAGAQHLHKEMFWGWPIGAPTASPRWTWLPEPMWMPH